MQDYGNSPHIDPRATFSRSDTASSGDWNASTNSPGLTDGSGTTNQYYRVSVAGTQDLGSGSITYAVGDYVKYSGSVWYKTTQPIGVTYWSNEKHVSSENLILQSSNFTTSWSTSNIAVSSSASAAPDSSSAAYLIYPNVNSTAARVYQTVQPSAGRVVISAYAKPAGKTSFGIIEKLLDGSTNYSWFDLTGSGSVGTSDGGHTASISQSGNGYYRCSIALTASGSANSVMFYVSDATGSTTATASGTDGVYIYGTQVENLSSGGPTVLSETTTQIHREYAPTLKYVTPATGGMARFEYDPTDGQSEGILVESQSTNLLNYSEQFDNAYWTKYRATIKANAAIAPSGELTADLFVAEQTGSSQTHIVQSASQAYTSGTAYTFSIFVKPAGFSKIRISAANTLTWAAAADYDLSGSGSVSGVTGTASAAAVGNGWFRCSLTGTAGATASTPTYVFLDNGSGTSFDGDDYSGVIIWGAMHEQASHSSSYLKVEGSTATRAADQLSITDSSLFAGNAGTIAFEGQTLGGSTGFGRFWSVSDGTNDNRIHVYPTSSTAVRFRVYRNNIEQRNVASGVTDVTQSNRYAFAYEDNKLRLAQNGSLLTDDSNSAVMPVVNKLSIGMNGSGSGNQMNGYIKRIAFYGQSLSDTEMTSLSS